MTPPNRTPVAFVQAILLGYEKYQIDPSDTLDHANISPAQLNDPSAYITTAQFESFMELAMRQLDDEALGWFSRPFWWGSYGMLARASVGAPDLRVALARWCRNHNLLTRDVVLRMTETAGVATVGIIEHEPLGAAREFCLVSILRNMLGYASWLIDSRVTCMYTAFPFPSPAHADVYPVMFSGPLRFDATHTSISFDAAYLELAVRRDERAVGEMLGNALPLLVSQYRRDRLLLQRVRSILITRLENIRNAQDMAQALNTSLRSLHRQLAEEGVSFQALKDEVRQTQAERLLCRSAMPLKQIAYTLGFSNDKSFARAFRRWFGMMPSEYRRQKVGGSPVDLSPDL